MVQLADSSLQDYHLREGKKNGKTGVRRYSKNIIYGATKILVELCMEYGEYGWMDGWVGGWMDDDQGSENGRSRPVLLMYGACYSVCYGTQAARSCSQSLRFSSLRPIFEISRNSAKAARVTGAASAPAYLDNATGDSTVLTGY
ncbi:hypothetical protein PAAG_07434 [Paracoccidioides lutzii Pb01]|uniref:Uncharacterized protein n=1 Tax=Paracoccidioides lutzii (strain ATCC MYA-826 / Pb01) TaxID=502779 RepID=C1H9J3_PARBA|nr:hypothetical protein PAAG_07434 [Paracoccidioides lutzii Pb01]EEH37016.2 hypothetical protein PAAG_07434 [Paracoccidioides lutzii Pb01]